ncbi:M14 family zinc carboxypeptidase [Desulfonema magnum]|uniref:Peptidase, M14 family n=1 Tax=Desulfonema magnum TaxID=45655 RepID=A0A975GM63_9BACT|nr:M14 family zinc carboxypeptidase [Desulfonema magnum]QTA86487.1 Peptidase, M14 family [Desulfonema magnum]
MSEPYPLILFTIAAIIILGCPRPANHLPSEESLLDPLRNSLTLQKNSHKPKVGPHSGHSNQKSDKTVCKIHLKPLIIISSQRSHDKTTVRKHDHLPIRRYTLGASNEKQPIEAIVIGHGKDAILILASFHGNEKSGTPLVRQLTDYLYKNPRLLQGRKVMILPVVNPDGGKRNSRYNARGVDLNRNFSTANRINNTRHGLKALSEPETRAVIRAIRQCHPNRIISLHQPLACIDYDGPGRKLADHIAKYCDLPVRKLGAMPGSLGSYAGVTLGIPTITLELPGGIEKFSPEHLWKRYGAALVASILYPDDFQVSSFKSQVSSFSFGPVQTAFGFAHSAAATVIRGY